MGFGVWGLGGLGLRVYCTEKGPVRVTRRELLFGFYNIGELMLGIWVGSRLYDHIRNAKEDIVNFLGFQGLRFLTQALKS